MRSASVKRALAKIGITKLEPGKTKITAAQSDAIFAEVLGAEFEPAVVKKSPADRAQHQLDAAVSANFNLGIGAMDWEWAKLWRAGKLAEAAAYLASHYNTTGGTQDTVAKDSPAGTPATPDGWSQYQRNGLTDAN